MCGITIKLSIYKHNKIEEDRAARHSFVSVYLRVIRYDCVLLDFAKIPAHNMAVAQSTYLKWIKINREEEIYI